MELNDSKKRFWSNYLIALSEEDINPKSHVWYQRHCEHFIRRNKELRLKQHTAKSVNLYLAKLINHPTSPSGVKKQAVDALRVLFKHIHAPLET